MKHYLSYILIRLFLFPNGFLPYRLLRVKGRFIGLCIFYFVPKFRKRALSNLSLAKSLNLSEKQIFSYAKASLQNLAVTFLEYSKFAREKKISDVARCENPEYAASLIDKKQSVIFFCGHQSNWEILFLEGTSRMPGVAIGRPIANHYLYNWITSIRQKFGGTMITPKNAIREGLRAIKQGKFLGIVGDQGMPDSGFSSLFFGRLAWTSPAPAILSHRTGAPIMVATTRRTKDGYRITYSDPIWPNQEAPVESEVDQMMKEALRIFEASIMKSPGEWLWSHNRWKQQIPGRLKKQFRFDSIAIFFPEEKSAFQEVFDSLEEIQILYPSEHVCLFIPETYKDLSISSRFEIQYYKNKEDLRVRDFRFKLVLNFSENKKLKKHFLALSAFHVFSKEDLCKIGRISNDTKISELLKEVCYAS